MLRSHSLLFTLSAALITLLLFIVDVHWRFGGNYNDTLKIGWVNGVSPSEDALHLKPTYRVGWNGQFYYSMSNDPFARDLENLKVISPPGYWYQRWFIPFLVFCVSRLSGWSITPPLVFHFVQFLIVMVGFWVLVRHLAREKNPLWLALAWLLGGGTLLHLFCGMLDPAADALFILSLVALDAKRWKLAFFILTSLALTRESYWLFAAGVWALLFLETARGKISRSTIFWGLIPVLSPLLLLGLLRMRFGHTQVDLQPGVLLWPKGIFVALFAALKDLSWIRMSRLTYSLLLMGTLVGLARKRIFSVMAFLPHLALFFFLHAALWESSGLKFLGSSMILLIWYGATLYPRWTAAMAAAHLGFGIWSTFGFLDTPDMRYEITTPMVKDYQHWGALPSSCSQALTAKGSLIAPEGWERVHVRLAKITREFKTVSLSLTNTGRMDWEHNHPYLPKALYLTYAWYRDGKLEFHGQRISFPHKVEPGKGVTGSIEIRLPENGEHQLKVFLGQNGCGEDKTPVAETSVIVSEPIPKSLRRDRLLERIVPL
ncbi:MAG: hypothetical protein HYR96_15705 [Deltaproteobacteria bacterium]|nr:hypothetical protein [Deltaproteobacteria bacterium]MBI3296500.1 hypothetical protein [Deltaproteobacteria bacterium]